MKIASIVPIANADRAFEGKYSMILAPLAQYFAPHTHKKQKGNFTILDNGVYEEGKAVDMDDLVRAAVSVGADEIILPDVIGDGDKTIDLMYESLNHIYRKGLKGLWRFMAVCQGATLADFIHCFEKLDAHPWIDTIGIPKVAGALTPIGRAGLEGLWKDSKKQIHLLGCYKNMIEYKAFSKPERIRSADTCLPALLSIRSTRGNAFEDRPEPTIDLRNEEINVERYDKILKHLAAEDLI